MLGRTLVGVLVVFTSLVLGPTVAQEASAQNNFTLCSSSGLERVADVRLPEGFCAITWATNVSGARGVVIAENGDLLVVEANRGCVSVFWDDDGDGQSTNAERATLACSPNDDRLTHGIAIDEVNHWLYASSPTTVYRWPYTAGNRTTLPGGEAVVTELPTGGHITRTLLLDKMGRLVFSVGSGSNLDANATRAAIFRATLPLNSTLEAAGLGPVTWGETTRLAEGMRNEVGLDWDQQGRLWGVENGVDNLMRPDLGGDIHNTNPAEEVNLFAGVNNSAAQQAASSSGPEGAASSPPLFYGYPFCWSEGVLPPNVGLGPGTQWAQPDFMNDGTHTDEWCRNVSNVVPPQFTMPAHMAPLDILFYQHQPVEAAGNVTTSIGSRASKASVPVSARLLSQEAEGDAFIALHGSWDRDEAVGREVVQLHFEDGRPRNVSSFFSYLSSPTISSSNPGSSIQWPHRPVGLAVGACGSQEECLFVTSDSTDVIFAIAKNA
jgi:glucose/arabinose dehydrogenase